MGDNSIRHRYLTDPHFKALVDLMTAHILENNYTPSEMREAAMLASLNYEMQHLRYSHFPDDVEKAIFKIHKFAESGVDYE